MKIQEIVFLETHKQTGAQPQISYKQTSRRKADVPPHENSRNRVSGDSQTNRSPK
jgi:hypothetical protein